jgi:hypothetical protein
MANSLLKVCLHFSICGSSLLNSQELCSVQMLQRIRMIMSIANGQLIARLMFFCCSLCFDPCGHYYSNLIPAVPCKRAFEK